MSPAKGHEMDMNVDDVGEVISVHVNPQHTFSKPSVSRITLLEGLGVEGDAHCGVTVQHRSRVAADPSQPNLRQVHLMHTELFPMLREAGFAIGCGDLGENLSTRGIALLDLPVGSRLLIGEAVISLTGLRNPCLQINTFRAGLLKHVVSTDADGGVVRLAGVMGTVSRGGTIRPGDLIRVALPPPPYHALTRV